MKRLGSDIEQMKEYNFASLADALKAIAALPDDKPEYNRLMPQIKSEAERFLKTRTNSELMNMADEVVIIEIDEVSLYDYMGSFYDWYNDEVDSRNWPIADSVMKVVKQWDEDWADEGSSFRKRFLEMEKQVKGIQKKIDRILFLLKDTKFTVSAEEAMTLENKKEDTGAQTALWKPKSPPSNISLISSRTLTLLRNKK